MDPNAALSRIEDAIDHDDLTEAREAAASLAGWLAAGGFAPTWSKYKRGAKWFKARYTVKGVWTGEAPRRRNADDEAEQEAIDERERNTRNPNTRTVAWAISEVFGDLTHDQARKLLKAIDDNDADTIAAIAAVHKRTGQRGLTGQAAPAFALLREKARDA